MTLTLILAAFFMVALACSILRATFFIVCAFAFWTLYYSVGITSAVPGSF